MFTNDPHAQSGDLPDLMAHIDAEYRSLPSRPETFQEFATSYLTENRPSEVFSVDNNYGILLTNGQRVKLCPDGVGGGRTGDMANPGQEIDITRRR